MKYDLLLQPFEPGAPFDPAGVEAALEARGVATTRDGTRVLKLGPGEVEIRRLMEGPTCVAVELKVPFSDKVELVRAAVVEAVGLAAPLGLRVVDPQLSRAIGLADEGAVAEQFLLNAQYAGHYMGVSEAIPASYSKALEKPPNVGTKVMVVFAIFLFFVWVGFRTIMGGGE